MFDSKSIQNVADLLTGYGQAIAVAESVTAGLLQNALSSAEKASEFFEGGITTYNVNQKYVQLHINLAHAVSCNCVSEQVAGEMALGVAKTFRSDWGVAVTGYASPVPGHEMKKFFACFAVVFRSEVLLTKTITSNKKIPLEVQVDYVDQIIRALMALIKDHAMGENG
jgi:nicotinamide-nucleotide amidase